MKKPFKTPIPPEEIPEGLYPSANTCSETIQRTNQYKRQYRKTGS